MSLVRRPERSLNPDERRVLKIRRHWVAMVPTILIAVAAVAFLAWLVALVPADYWLLSSVLWYAMLAADGWLSWRALHWWHSLLIATDKRFMYARGLLSTEVDNIPVKKAADYERKDPLLGQMLGYANFRIESAGKESLQDLRLIPHPNAVEEVISRLILSGGIPPHRNKGTVTGQSRQSRSVEPASE